MSSELIAQFAASVARASDVPVLVAGDTVWSRARLDHESDRVATRLGHLPAGERVAFLMAKSCEAVAVVLGALKAGVAFVPINNRWPRARQLRVLELARPRVLFTDEPGDFPSVETVRWADLPSQTAPPARSPDPGAYTLFTSGSTGDPKGVQIGRAALHAFARNIEPILTLRQDEEQLACMAELSFDISIQDLLSGFLGKGTMHLIDSTIEPLALVDYIARHRLTYLSTVPTTYALLVASRRWIEAGQLASLRVLCAAGSALYSSTARAVREMIPDARLFNLYGPTEATIYCAGYEVTDAARFDRPSIPIGLPFPGQLFLYDDGSRITDTAEHEAELLIGGTQLMSGYLGEVRGLETVEWKGERHEMYRSGDLVTGIGAELTFTGRKGGFLKSRGYRISPAEIEAAYLEHPDIRECALIGREDPVVQNILVLYYVPARPVTHEALLAYGRTKLPAYSVPAELVALDVLPKSSAGKMDHGELRRRAMAEPAAPAVEPVAAVLVPTLFDRVARSAAEVLARINLRRCTSVGRGTIGNATIHNEGVIRLGARCQLLDYRGLDLSLLSAGPRGTVELGEGCVVNYGTVVSAQARVVIGKRVSIGMQCIIADSRFPGDPWAPELEPPRPVVIGDDVWLAARVVVLPGVTIGARTVVMAGSIVTTDLPAGVVAGGNPARVERMRPAATT